MISSAVGHVFDLEALSQEQFDGANDGGRETGQAFEGEHRRQKYEIWSLPWLAKSQG